MFIRYVIIIILEEKKVCGSAVLQAKKRAYMSLRLGGNILCGENAVGKES